MRKGPLHRLGMYFSEILKDNDGAYSSKRFVTVVGFFMLCFAFCVDVFTEIHVASDLIEGMMYIVMAGLGVITWERFGGRGGGGGPVPRDRGGYEHPYDDNRGS